MADMNATAVTPIVALDVDSAERAMSIVRLLGDRCRFYKVGSELFTRTGPDLVGRLRDEGSDIFLDLKFHDIPNTVRGAVRSAAALGAKLVTVHASGGRAMLEAARDAAGDACGVLAVSILTSLDDSALGEAWGRREVRVEEEVLRLADLSAEAGLHGLVCSGREAAAVRAQHGDRLALLIPGIRLPGGASHDQARTVTPGEARTAGARYVVVGRAVTASEDSRGAMDAIRAALAG
jgi:orotidine-5'-phosphate decarboxylase